MSKETIHSGHFMTSNPHTEIQGEDGEDDEDVEVDVVDVEDGVNGSSGEKGTVTTNASNKVGGAGKRNSRPRYWYIYLHVSGREASHLL